MSHLSTRIELTVPEGDASTFASLLRSRTGADVVDLGGGALQCDLPHFDAALADAVGGWLAGMSVGGATVRTGIPGEPLRKGWPPVTVELAGWLGVNVPPSGADGVGLTYDPGICFGSAHHPTTTACAQSLASVVRRGVSGARVLEIGCGAGLFSVALAKLGATVSAVDTWEDAVATTRRNAQANGVADRVDARQVDARWLEHPEVDIVVANLAPSAALGPVLAPLARRCVVLAGLQESQMEQVRGGYAALTEAARNEESHWLSVLLVRVGP